MTAAIQIQILQVSDCPLVDRLIDDVERCLTGADVDDPVDWPGHDHHRRQTHGSPPRHQRRRGGDLRGLRHCTLICPFRTLSVGSASSKGVSSVS